MSGELGQAVATDPVAKEIVELAQPLEGLTRADSIHAAGVVIGAKPLIETIPLQQKGPDAEVVTQFSMNTVEALGLLKMDFLGLRNLDVIKTAVELIGGDLDITAIPLDDRKTYEMLARGEAMGVFQFESSGMREALRQVKPTEFEDLIALVALYRPGPMAYIPTMRRESKVARASRSRTNGSSRSPRRPTGSASTRSSTWRSPNISPASARPRRTIFARRSARRSTR